MREIEWYFCQTSCFIRWKQTCSEFVWKYFHKHRSKSLLLTFNSFFLTGFLPDHFLNHNFCELKSRHVKHSLLKIHFFVSVSFLSLKFREFNSKIDYDLRNVRWEGFFDSPINRLAYNSKESTYLRKFFRNDFPQTITFLQNQHGKF